MTFGEGIAQSVQWICYGLDDRGIVVRFPTGARVYSLLQTTRLSPGRNQIFPRCATTDIHLVSRLGMVKLSLVRLGQVLGFPGLLDNIYVQVVMLSAISIGRLYPSRNIPYIKRLSWPQGHSAAGRIRSMENPKDLIGNRTRALPQPTAPQRKSKFGMSGAKPPLEHMPQVHVLCWNENNKYLKLPNNNFRQSTITRLDIYEGWNFNSGNYLFTTDTK